MTLSKVSSPFFRYHSTSVTRYLIFYVRPVLWRKIHVMPMCLYGSTFAPQHTTEVNPSICIFHEKRYLWQTLCQFLKRSGFWLIFIVLSINSVRCHLSPIRDFKSHRMSDIRSFLAIKDTRATLGLFHVTLV